MGSQQKMQSPSLKAQTGELTTLDKGVIGQYYQVMSLNALGQTVARRLESVGMTVGSVLSVLNNKSRGTDIIRLRETRWALGRSITSCIQVRPLDGPPVPNRDLTPEARGASCQITSAPQGLSEPDAEGREVSRG